ncbi:DUF4339 domain-containing protein [Shewanella maritima]|uniref:DUF4339 domain-containing protein n=1 Tax=Shewanella maritima TaxID=2520507 RepID=UPI0037353A72
MTKWFFSKNGDVTGPLSEAEAKAFVQNDPECYGWHPSFTHWKPVGKINEFAELVPEIAPPAQIPQSLIDDFVAKKQDIANKVESMNDSIKFTKTYLYELEQEINIYKRLTNSLTDEVKGNIRPFEQKYEAFNSTFEELANALAIAKGESEEVIAEFDKRVAEREAEALASISVPPAAVPSIADLHDNVAEIKPKSASSLDNVAVRVKPKDVAASLDPVAETPKAPSLDATASKPKPKIDKIEFTEETTAESSNKDDKLGVSSILKSVFKGDAKKSDSHVESNVTKLTTGNDKKPTPEKNQSEEVAEETEAERENRMRRRRRRR